MHPLNKSAKIAGLITIVSFIGLTSLKLIPKANANPLNRAIATYNSPREYNPSAKYFVQGGLFTYSPNSRINVRTGPGTQYYARHYGLPGDRVIILNHAYSNDGYRWWYLKFNESGAKGWIREDFVAIPDSGLQVISQHSRP